MDLHRSASSMCSLSSCHVQTHWQPITRLLTQPVRLLFCCRKSHIFVRSHLLSSFVPQQRIQKWIRRWWDWLPPCTSTGLARNESDLVICELSGSNRIPLSMGTIFSWFLATPNLSNDVVLLDVEGNWAIPVVFLLSFISPSRRKTQQQQLAIRVFPIWYG